MKKIIVWIGLLLVLGGCLQGSSFDGAKQLKEYEKEYGVSDVKLAPGNVNELADFELKLRYLRKAFEEQQSREAKALLLAIDSRLDFAKAQYDYFKVNALSSTIGIFDYDCSDNGNIKEALRLLKDAKAFQKNGLLKRERLKIEYYDFAEKNELHDITELEKSVDVLDEINDKMQARLKFVCDYSKPHK